MTETRVLCVTCTKQPPRRSTPGYLTCDRCVELIRECIQEIPDLYAVVARPSSLLPSVAPGARRGPGFSSRSPANDTTIVLTDPRTTWTEEQPYHNALIVLESWARMVREDVGQKPPVGPANITGEARLLVARLDFITRQAWVEDMWAELKETRAQLRAHPACDEQERRRLIGPCPNLVDGRDCGAPLHAPLYGDTVQCHSCDRRWPRPEWQHLGRTMGVIA